MKTKILFVLITGGTLGLAAWLLHEANPAQADEIPEKYRDTVHKGLEYLVKNQHQDGHWEGPSQGEEGGKHPVAMTGLAGLALLMEDGKDGFGGRFNRKEAKYAANIRKAVDWLMDKSPVPQGKGGRDGLIFSGHPSETSRYMQGHGLATLFLAGVFEGESDSKRKKKLEDVLTRAVKYIVNAQSTQGGWYHTSRVEGHDFDAIAPTVIQIQALQAAREAGIPVPGEVVSDAQEYLKTKLAKDDGAKPGRNQVRPAEFAAALACRAPDVRRNDELCVKWLKVCETEIGVGRVQFGRDELTHYYYAQAVYYLMNSERGGSARPGAWKDYRTALFDQLHKNQNKDGSWPATTGADGFSLGPVHAAAVWCTVLQLDKKGHPVARERHVERL